MTHTILLGDPMTLFHMCNVHIYIPDVTAIMACFLKIKYMYILYIFPFRSYIKSYLYLPAVCRGQLLLSSI